MSARALPLPADPERTAADGAPARTPRAVSRKWVASLLSILLLAAVVLPVGQNWAAVPRDDFPFSYYPMFSFEKGDRQRVTYLIVADAAGNRFLLPYLFAGSGGMNQVRRQMARLIDRGQAPRLCRNVASRVARSGDLPAGLETVQIVTGTFLMTEFFAGNRAPLSEMVRAQCPVPRG